MASLLSWLGNEVKAIGAQLNPFDNGATYNTVINNQPTNLQRAQQSINNANQQIQATQNPRGVLANQQAFNAFRAQQAQQEAQRQSLLAAALHTATNTVNNDVVKPVNRNLVQPTVQSIQNAGDVLNAGRQGVGGLVNIAAANATNNATARQNAINRTQAAVNYSLNASRGMYTPQEASSPNITTSLLKPTLRGVATYAPLALGPETASLAGPEASALAKLGISAATGGGIGASSTALGQVANGQKLNVKDIAKAGVAGAGLGLAGEGASLLKNDRIPLNQTGAVGKNVNKENLNKGAFSPADRANLEKQLAVDQAKAEARVRAAPQEPLSAQAERQLRPKPEPNPMTPGPLDNKIKLPPPVTSGNSAQAFLNADFVANKIKSVGAKAETAVKQLSPNDQKLMQQLQTKGIDAIASKAENPTQLRSAEQALRTYYDTRIAYDHANGIPTPYRQNYLRDLIPPAEKGGQFAATGGSKAPGYILPKENAGATGVLEGLQRDIAGSSFNHGKLTYAKGLEQAFPDQISRGQPIVGDAGVTQQLRTPYGNELFATKDIASGINKREIAPKATGALAKYDSANAFVKYAKLSGGAFHAFTEGGNFIGHQIMNGKLFTEPASTGKMFKVAFSDKALRNEVGNLAKNGTLDKAQLSGLTWTPAEIKADVSITPRGNVAKYTGLKALHDATFQREIPYAKLKSFEQATKGLDPNNPVDLASMRSAAKGINQGYGGINRTVEGLTPRQAKIAARGLLATDFTEGKIRTITAAISKGGPEGKIARQIIAGKVLLFAGLATAGGVLAGEYKDKNPTQIAENILGNFINPTFKAGSNIVSFPATHISEFGKPLTPLFKSGTNKTSGITDYAKNRLAAIPSEIGQLASNKDYSGNHIYGKETKKAGGAPISPAKTALNVASGVLPIPVSQGINTGQGKQSIPAAIANIAGLKVRPDQTQTPAGQKAQTAASTAQEISQLKAKPPQGYDLRDVGNGKYAYTINGEVKTTSKLTTAQRAIAEDAFKNSGDSQKIIGDTVYRKSTNGSISTTPKIKYDYSVNSATLTQQKGAGDISGYLTTAKKQLQNIQQQLTSPNTDALDKITLQNEAQALLKNVAKYTSYGGFTKPKSGRSGGGRGSRGGSTSVSGLSSAIKTAGRTKISLPKGIKVNVPKANFKAPVTKKLAVSKIPITYKKKRIV